MVVLLVFFSLPLLFDLISSLLFGSVVTVSGAYWYGLFTSFFVFFFLLLAFFPQRWGAGGSGLSWTLVDTSFAR